MTKNYYSQQVSILLLEVKNNTKDFRLKVINNVYLKKEEGTNPFQEKLFVYFQVLKGSGNLWQRLVISSNDRDYI